MNTAERKNPEWINAERATRYLTNLTPKLPRELWNCDFSRWIWAYGKPVVIAPYPGETKFIDAASLMAQADGIAILITLPETVCIKFLSSTPGKIDFRTKNLLKLFDGSYVEWTPDRMGLQLFCKGVFPNVIFGKTSMISIITTGSERYVCLTGDQYQPSVDRHLWYAQGNINELIKRTGDKKRHHSIIATAPVNQSSTEDSTVILKAMNSKNKAKFRRLWEGDSTGYKSKVVADMALLGMLAYWSDRDRSQVDRLYRMSGMYRESWDNKRVKDIPYGQATLNYVFSK